MFARLVGIGLICCGLAVATAAVAGAAERLPNLVIIYIDDMGYADIGPFGAEGYETPHLDRMAAEGRIFTDFYVTQAVCSASRAGLMTGCYNVRVGIQGALAHRSNIGLHADEMTLAELVKQKGYATAIYGKWHLGHHPKFLPTAQGFDEYFGIPYSNDMWPYHPTAKNGFPPLHRSMRASAWTEALSSAFRDIKAMAGRGEEPPIDPYAGESPAEYFAVLSEYFFERPELIVAHYPAVYRQLAAFYRQDPETRRRKPP